jgi:copper chaperone CopZ
MTCDHCVRAVTAEVSKIAGVERVDVDLSTGSVTVVAVEPVDHAALAAAIDEAGYEVVS